MELKGTVKKIGEIQTFASGFQKQEMVITTEEQYPQPIAIDFLKDKIGLLENLKVGDSVTVGINIGGREWTNPQGETRYFNSITGWRIEKVGGSQQSDMPPMPNDENLPPFLEPSNNSEPTDDLPF